MVITGNELMNIIRAYCARLERYTITRKNMYVRTTNKKLER